MHLVHAPIATPASGLGEAILWADRHTLAKRRWRGVAEDGTEFGFELERPLRPGDVVRETAAVAYVVRQHPEPVIAVNLGGLPPSAAAGIGWAVGNLHLELSAEPSRLIAADEPALRQLLTRLQVPFEAGTAVFRPGRFSRGTQSTHELGPGHRH